MQQCSTSHGWSQHASRGVNRSAKAALVKLPPFVTCCLRGTQHHPEEILTHLFLDGDCFRVDN